MKQVSRWSSPECGISGINAVLLLWLAVLLFGVALAGIVLAFCLLLFRRWQTGKFIFKSGWFLVPMGCGTGPFVAIFLLIAIPWGCQTIRPASSDFEEAFGFAPGPEIKNLKGKTEPGIDSRRIYLAFDRSDAALETAYRLTAGRHSWRKSDMVDSLALYEKIPDWWRGASPWTKRNVCLESTHHEVDEHNGWGDIVIVNCRSDGRIYVLLSRID
jgi:hypothetical protein